MSSLSTAVLVLTYLLPLVLVVVGLIALFRVIGRAVPAGIRDARADADGGTGRSRLARRVRSTRRPLTGTVACGTAQFVGSCGASMIRGRDQSELSMTNDARSHGWQCSK